MTRVFLSYCRDNLSEAHQLHSELSQAGVHVLWDQDSGAGVDFRAAIRRDMSAADFVVTCFSAETQARDRNGIYPEIRDAIDTLRQLGPCESYLIPVKLSDCEIPEFTIDGNTSLRHLNHIDLFGPDRNDNLRRLIETLRPTPDFQSEFAEQTGRELHELLEAEYVKSRSDDSIKPRASARGNRDRTP